MASRDGALFDMQIKLLTIGDSGVGKTCLLMRYTSDSFSPSAIYTIGIDFKVKNITVEGKKIKLQIWDTAGQERFRTITTSYFRGAQGIVLVYDVTDRTSFASIRNWVEQIKMHAQEGVNTILVGNKCDCPTQRMVSVEEGGNLAREFDNMPFFETSAKQNYNIDEMFLRIVTDVKNRLLSNTGPGGNAGTDNGHKLQLKNKGTTAAKSNCC